MLASPNNLAPAQPAAPAPAEEASDETLVAAACSGDRAAFSRLYARYSRMVRSVLLSRVGPTDADDLTQEVFLKAMFRLGSLRRNGLVGPWLATIARHKAASLHRSTWRRKRRPLGPEPAAEPAREGLKSHEVLHAIQQLPEAYREILIMRLVEQMTGPEIAAKTGRSHGAVRVHLFKGMALLRDRLSSEVNT
jgi:RNA polymerase sigma-70 factor (ECF subfamily)